MDGANTSIRNPLLVRQEWGKGKGEGGGIGRDDKADYGISYNRPPGPFAPPDGVCMCVCAVSNGGGVVVLLLL